MLPTRALLIAASCCLALVGCERAQELGGNPTVRRVDQFEAPEDDRSLTAAEKASRDERIKELTEFHGQRPRIYNGLLNGSAEAEQCFAAKLAEVTAFVNERLAARGANVTLDEYEVAANFITEGGYFVLQGDKLTGIDGYSEVGVDTLVSNYRPLEPFLHEGVKELVEAGRSTTRQINERGETVLSLAQMNIEEALYASAGIFAYEKANVARDMRNPDLLRRWCGKKGKTPHADLAAVELSSLPSWQQYFWTTVYFNAGTGRGREFLCQHGVSWASQAHTAEANVYSAKYNAAWRTATYRLMRDTAGPTIASYCERKTGAACVCDECALLSGCGSCAEVDGCGWCEERRRCSSLAADCPTYLTDPATCPGDSPIDVNRPCEEAISCEDCFSAGSGTCGWCASSNTCSAETPGGTITTLCASWYFEGCPAVDSCTQHWCVECLAEEGCGYCQTHQACGRGSAAGPASGVCESSAWTFEEGPSSCSTGGSDAGVPEPGCVSPHDTCASSSDCCSDPATPGPVPSCILNRCESCELGEGRLLDTCGAEMSSCCGGLVCSSTTSVADERCCASQGDPCTLDPECCGEMSCVSGLCQCRTTGESCFKGRECCGSLLCSSGVCG